jgi:hypothetical protein
MLTCVVERDTGTRDQVPYGSGNNNLARARRAHDARRKMNGDAQYIRFRPFNLASMQANADIDAKRNGRAGCEAGGVHLRWPAVGLSGPQAIADTDDLHRSPCLAGRGLDAALVQRVRCRPMRQAGKLSKDRGASLGVGCGKQHSKRSASTEGNCAFALTG